MKLANTLALAQKIPGIARVAQPDGTWVVYEPGDSLPPELFGPQNSSNVPSEVTMRQARLALLAANKLSAVDSAINSLPEPAKTHARITWDYSSTVQRHNGLVQQLGPTLGLSPAQIDALFVAAAAL